METSDLNPGALDRRTLLRAAAAGAVAGGARPRGVRAGSAMPYKVGVGVDPGPYAATLRAIQATGEWNPVEISGKRVVIKPNLVISAIGTTGATTDARVTLALVDLALASNAAEVIIIETSPSGAHFDGTGYGFFDSYDPQGRVRLLDLADAPMLRKPTASRLAYRSILLPELLFDPNVFFITAAKLKVHSLTQVTLAMKNQFGLPPIAPYRPPNRNGRFGMHDRSANQTVVDLNSARMPDFALVDASWGMERRGPAGGDPVQLDTVIAGRNALAVDLACLEIMQVPLSRILHLQLAAVGGMGPPTLADVALLGDPLPIRPFVMPAEIPLVSVPRATPAVIRPALGETSTMTYSLTRPALLRSEIVLPNQENPDLPTVRLFYDWAIRGTGPKSVVWDGRRDDGNIVPPGVYALRVGSKAAPNAGELFSFGWIEVRA